jgi:hypothetical protein
MELIVLYTRAMDHSEPEGEARVARKERRCLLVADGSRPSPLLSDLRARMLALAAQRGYEAQTLVASREGLPPCIGCLDCLTKHPGTCIFDAALRPIAAMARSCAVLVFLSSSSFGNAGSAIKNIIDRGALIVPATTRQILIGCAEGAGEEEAGTFVDIIAKHRGEADVVHPRFKEDFRAYFSREREDNARITALIGDSL